MAKRNSSTLSAWYSEKILSVYGIRDLGTELSPITMLVMMESIQNRIIANGKRGAATWLYIDEFYGASKFGVFRKVFTAALEESEETGRPVYQDHAEYC